MTSEMENTSNKMLVEMFKVVECRPFRESLLKALECLFLYFFIVWVLFDFNLLFFVCNIRNVKVLFLSIKMNLGHQTRIFKQNTKKKMLSPVFPGCFVPF